ncbi:MAG: DUF1501 domain-containing protein [Opitutales bacterium]|nr:DUF1501 domain-containing protein [Opitutales bacterium]
MNPIDQYVTYETRRQFLGKAAKGLGIAALSSMPGPNAQGASSGQPALGTGHLGSPHFPAKAKRGIYLFMSGAPSQLDMYDYKPEMKALFDKDLPDSIRRGQRLTTMTSGQVRFPVAPSIYEFEQVGKGGAWMSELLPYTKKVADDIAIIKSMYTEAINHDPAITYIQTGNQIPGRPSMGAWLSYGLGSLNENLPTFVILNSTWTGRKEAQALYSRLWGAGPLPSEHQGVAMRSKGDPVLYLTDPHGVSRDLRRKMLDGVNEINEDLYHEFGDPETHARISQYEMAFRMQSSVPELTDLSDEPDYIFDLYGPDAKIPGTFAYNCLMARRLAEKGVRFSQIFHRGWDQHGVLPKDLPNQCKDIDQATYALITDLKQRGMFDDTLVVWGGEFGRTIYCQGTLTETNYGRDHHPRCFTKWIAGAGIKGGTVYGDTDEFSYNITENPVHIRDLNATILNQFGINHETLNFRHQGLDLRLTGVEEARVVKEILT